MAKGRNLIRQDRAPTRSTQLRPAEVRYGRPAEPALREQCGAVFSRHVWRRPEAPSATLLANVEARERAGRPERRIVSITVSGDEREVPTTSQKLAHRIAHALRCYVWADDGMLSATRERA